MKGGALPSLSSRDRLPGLAVATPGLCYVPHKSSSCFTDALPHLGAGLICQAELPGKFFCSVIDTVTNSAAFLLRSFFPPSFLQRAPLMPSDAADSRSWGWMPWWIYIVLLHLSLFLPRCWPPCALIRMLSQFCNSKQNRYLQLSWSQRVFMLQKPLPISVVCEKLWQAVGNLGGIRSRRSGRETEGSGELGCVSIAPVILCHHSIHSEDGKYSFKTVTYLVPFILHPWCGFDPLNPDLIVSFHSCRHYS